MTRFPIGNSEYLRIGKIFKIDNRIFAVWMVSSLEGHLYELKDDDSWEAIQLERYGAKVINYIVKDDEDGLWITTDRGLFHLIPRKMLAYTPEEGLADLQVFAMAEDAEGGVWISVWGDGVQRLHQGRLTTYSTGDGLLDDHVLTFLPESDGSMWLGTLGGIVRVHDDRVVEVYPYTFGTSSMYLWDLHRDRRDRLWVAVRNQLRLFQRGIYERVLPEIRHNVKFIHEDRTGRLWVGSEMDIYTMDPDGDWERFDEINQIAVQLNAISEDARGTEWFSTLERGLWRKTEDGFFVYDVSKGLKTNRIHYAIDDEAGSLWLGTDNGLIQAFHTNLDSLFRGETNRLRTVVFDEGDGLPSAELSSPSSAFRAKDGTMWFGTMGGAAAIDPQNIAINTTRPKIQIQAFEVLGEGQPVESGMSFQTGSRNSFTFEYATLSFRDARRNRYRYRLSGYEDDWHVDANARKQYTRLSPGEYTFEVYGSNNDGVWSESPATLSFTILPVFYQALWFQWLVGGVLVGILGLWRRQVHYKNQLRIALTRHTIADDLHDDIGSKIGGVAQTLDFMNRRERLDDADRRELGRQVQVARELVDDLRDSVWIVDAEKDTLNELIARMKEFVGRIAPAHHVEINIRSEVKDREIEVRWRRHVYLAFKEALHNVVRHADASAIVVDIVVSSQQFRFEVKDDGRGIDSSEGAIGRGLASMNRRAKAVGGRLAVESEAGRGTRISFVTDMP